MAGWSQKSSGGSGGGLAPAPVGEFDDVKITRDVDGDPIMYQFYLTTVLVNTILVFYDVDKNPSEYKAI